MYNNGFPLARYQLDCSTFLAFKRQRNIQVTGDKESEGTPTYWIREYQRYLVESREIRTAKLSPRVSVLATLSSSLLKELWY